MCLFNPVKIDIKKPHCSYRLFQPTQPLYTKLYNKTELAATALKTLCFSWLLLYISFLQKYMPIFIMLTVSADDLNLIFWRNDRILAYVGNLFYFFTVHSQALKAHTFFSNVSRLIILFLQRRTSITSIFLKGSSALPK